MNILRSATLLLLGSATCTASRWPSADPRVAHVATLLQTKYAALHETPECMSLIAKNTTLFIVKHGRPWDFNALLAYLSPDEEPRTLSSDEEPRTRGNAALAFGAINSFPQGPSLQCRPETLRCIAQLVMTTESLYYGESLNSGLILDSATVIEDSTPHDILHHVLERVENLPGGAWKSSGLFAANVFKWHDRQPAENRESADRVLERLMNVRDQSLFSPQTILHALNNRRHPHSPPSDVQSTFVMEAMRRPEMARSSLDLVIRRFAWMDEQRELAAALLPAPGSDRERERTGVQTDIETLAGGLDTHAMCLGASQLIAFLVHHGDAAQDEASSGINVERTVNALLGLEYESRHTVAEAILLRMPKGEVTAYHAAIVDCVVASGQRVDVHAQHGERTIGAAVRAMVAQGLRLSCAPVNTNLYRLIVSATREAESSA